MNRQNLILASVLISSISLAIALKTTEQEPIAFDSVKHARDKLSQSSLYCTPLSESVNLVVIVSDKPISAEEAFNYARWPKVSIQGIAKIAHHSQLHEPSSTYRIWKRVSIEGDATFLDRVEKAIRK